MMSTYPARAIVALFTGALAFGIVPASAAGIARDGSHDFDFFFGAWRVHHRVLLEEHWYDFEGTVRAQPVMDGAGNVDDNVIHGRTGTYRAVTVRIYDPTTHDWYIRWIDGRTPGAPADPPLRGRFVDGVGTFFADDTLNGKPIRVRFRWSEITATSCRWDQAISYDGGATWEANYVMEFTRVGVP